MSSCQSQQDDCCCCCSAEDPCQKHDPCRSKSTPCRTRGKSYRNKCVPHCGLGKTECYCNAVCVVCDRKTRVNNPIYTEQMKSGYMGHVPLAQYYLGLSFPEAAILGVAEFECSRNRRRQCKCENNCNNNPSSRPYPPKFPFSSLGSNQNRNQNSNKDNLTSKSIGIAEGCGKFDLNLKPRNFAGYAGWRFNCTTAPKTEEMANLAKPPKDREKGIDCYLCPCPVPCACPFPCCPCPCPSPCPCSCPCSCPGPCPCAYPCCHSCCIAQIPNKSDKLEKCKKCKEKENITPSIDVATQAAPPVEVPASDKPIESIKSSNKVESEADHEDERLKKVRAYPCPSPCCPSVMPCFPCSTPCCPYPRPCPCPCPYPPCPSLCPCPFQSCPCPSCPCPCPSCPCPCPSCPCPCSSCPCSSCKCSCSHCSCGCTCPSSCPRFCCCGPSMKNYETCPTPPPLPLKIYFAENKNQPPLCEPPSICPPCCCYVPCPQPCCVVKDRKNTSNNANGDDDDCELPDEFKQVCSYNCPDECNPPYPCSKPPGVVCACPCYPEHPSQMILTRHPPNTLPVTCCSCCKTAEPLNAGIYPKLAANAITQWSLQRQRTISFLRSTNKTCCLPHDLNTHVYAGCDCCCCCDYC